MAGNILSTYFNLFVIYKNCADLETERDVHEF